MRNYFKTTIVFALVALFTFSACSKDEKVTPNDELRRVSLKLNQELVDQLGTRAVGPHIDDAKTVVFNAGYIYFTNASGGITETIEIVGGEADYADGKVGIKTLTDKGIVVENVDAGSTHVHIAGNITVPESVTNISEVMATAITLESQADDNGGVENVALHGVGKIESVAEATHESGKKYQFKAKVDVDAINSRMEIGKFTAGKNIESYTIEGIFINNYYTTMTFGGAVKAENLMDNEKDAEKYAEGKGSYAAGVKGIIYDYNATEGLGVFEAPVTWANDKQDISEAVWGYNFLIANEVVAPQIAIRINNVKLKGDNPDVYEGVHFISIRNFYVGTYDPESKTNKELEMAKGNVYRIADLEFDENDLRKNPFEDSKGVLVEATLLEWASTDIGYELD